MEELAEEGDDITEESLMLDVPYFGKGGIRSAELVSPRFSVVPSTNDNPIHSWRKATRLSKMSLTNSLH